MAETGVLLYSFKKFFEKFSAWYLGELPSGRNGGHYRQNRASQIHRQGSLGILPREDEN
jgi:hypothetical protein